MSELNLVHQVGQNKKRHHRLFFFLSLSLSLLTHQTIMNQDRPSNTLIPPMPKVDATTMTTTSTPPSLPMPLPLDQYRFTSVPPLQHDSQPSTTHPPNTQNDLLSRAGLSPKARLLVFSSVGCFWGFGIGAFIGGRQSGLQYLAENAHRLPTTVQGWYFYHKTKNYRVMLGGVKKGMRFAVKTGSLCFLYGVVEAGLDDIRGEADIINSVTAGVTTGAIFSTISKSPLIPPPSADSHPSSSL
jgi:hypothetical protein